MMNAELIRESFQKLAPAVDDLTDRFFEALFEEYPQWKSLFNRVNLEDHRGRFARGLGVMIYLGDDGKGLKWFSEQLGARHVNYGAGSVDFSVAVPILLHVLGELAGSEVWTAECAAAWKDLLENVVGWMQEGVTEDSQKIFEDWDDDPALVGAGALVAEQQQQNQHGRPATDDRLEMDDTLSDEIEDLEDFSESNDSASRQPLPNLGRRSQLKPSPQSEASKPSPRREDKNMITATRSGNGQDVAQDVPTDGGATDGTDGGVQDGLAEAKQNMLDSVPFNVMMADIDLRITYANPKSLETLKTLEHLLPVKTDQIIGQSIDIFHKDPASQRALLNNLKNLPHRATIQVGPEKLDLLVSAVHDSQGNYIGPMLTWDVVTEKLQIENEMARIQNMMENIPINVMMANLDFELVYMNPASAQTLRPLAHMLPVPLDELIGQKIDILHKEPEYQRRILADPNNLPHQAKIKLGEDTLDLLVTAIRDRDGNYIGPMITWEVITDRVKLAEGIMEGVAVVASSATELQANAKSMASTAEETSRQSQVVAAASEQATRNVETVSSATEELTASISEISRHVQDASKISGQAVEEAETTNKTITELGEASQEIGQVIKVITSIAQQTNLLALNATIEAARAGEAGKGFAVVANEVKELARQTANATEDISAKISAIQSSTGVAVTAIGSISGTIGQINEIATTIAGAVEEQTAATNEIARNVGEAAKGTAEVSSNIGGVAQAADESGKASSDILAAADSLAQEAVRLEQIVKSFIE